MFLKKLLRPFLTPTSPLLLAYHKVMAVVAAVYYGFPARKLKVIGLTGTNGKTTVANLIAKVLTANGEKVGMTSTVNFQLGDEVWMNATKMSTQSPFFIQKFLRKMVNAGCTYAVLEITSHALVQSRTWGVDLDVALITNVTGDHIEYHGGFEEYKMAKALLFKQLLEINSKSDRERVSILNTDDAYFDYFDALPSEKKLTYGLNGGSCFASDIQYAPEGTSFELHTPVGMLPILLRLPGAPNVYNALAVACVAVAVGVPLVVLQRVLAETAPVAGRYELIDEGQPFHVVVDYAHNIDAVKSIVTMYSGILEDQKKDGKDGKLIVVFGATGGGRDKAKRPVMGKILDEFADVLILTDDDPYEEDEWEILTMVAEGVSRDEGNRYWKIPSRREAIGLAVSVARAHDIVLIAGKGAEPVQMVYGQRRDWDDRLVVRELLRPI